MLCTDWTTRGSHRHRCTRKGYASPEVADDLALRVVMKLEEMRQRRGLRPEQVVLVGVDNSTTAFAMAVLRLLPSEARYSFCSGKKGTEMGDEYCGCMDCESCCGTLDDYGYDESGLWVVIDDDICQGRAVRTVARQHDVHWFGINCYLGDSIDWCGHPAVEWLHNATFHWWGAASFLGFTEGAEPMYRCMDGTEILHEYHPDYKEGEDDEC